jgi:hypothetical protein
MSADLEKLVQKKSLFRYFFLLIRSNSLQDLKKKFKSSKESEDSPK